MFLDGRYEGRLVLYEADKYPYECMGPCRFLWKPVTKGECDVKNERTLWIWTHPSIYMQLQNELVKIWDMKKSETNQGDDPPKVRFGHIFMFRVFVFLIFIINFIENRVRK